MEELTPEIRHWSAVHPNIGWVVSSYWLPGLGVLLDPLEVPEEVDGVEEIVLSNRHHRRSAFEARERFGAVVRVPRVGLHEFVSDPVEPYDFGEPLVGRRDHGLPGDRALARRRCAAHPVARTRSRSRTPSCRTTDGWSSCPTSASATRRRAAQHPRRPGRLAERARLPAPAAGPRPAGAGTGARATARVRRGLSARLPPRGGCAGQREQQRERRQDDHDGDPEHESTAVSVSLAPRPSSMVSVCGSR